MVRVITDCPSDSGQRHPARYCHWFFHVLDAPAPHCVELLIRKLHPSCQHIHHHVLLHCQLKEQTADAVLGILNRTTQDGRQRRRQVGGGLLT